MVERWQDTEAVDQIVDNNDVNGTTGGAIIMKTIDGERLINRIHTLGAVGIDSEGRRTRLAGSDEDKAGRDLVCRWMEEAGLKVVVDQIGNIFGIWETEENKGKPAFMVGSHIDTVINAGQYDGCLR